MSVAWIETARLVLHPFERRDVDSLHALWCLPDVRRFLWDDVEISRETAAEVVEASRASFRDAGYGLCRLSLRGSDDVVGFAGLRGFEHPVVGAATELLYGLDPSVWHRGLATEASVAALCLGFEHCALEAIHAGIDPPNVRSRAVLERLGFARWERVEIDGLPADYASLARGELPQAALAEASPTFHQAAAR